MIGHITPEINPVAAHSLNGSNGLFPHNPSTLSTNHDPEKLKRIQEFISGVENWMSKLVDPDQVVELRALKVERDDGKGYSTWAGTFRGTEIPALVKCAFDISGRCAGVYYTLNPLKPERFFKQAPRLQRMGKGQLTCDDGVADRHWILIDVDPVKPEPHKNDSSSAEEKVKTLIVANQVREYLTAEGWPAPILSDSGNAYHLLYRIIPLPVDPNQKHLPPDDPIRRTLLHLSDKFSGQNGIIDTQVFNPGRIVKFPGTMTCKGEDTPERPHRRAKVLEIPEAISRVPHELIIKMAGQAPVKSTGASKSTSAISPGSNQKRNYTQLTPLMERRAKGILDKVDPAIEGQLGSNPTLWAARCMVTGFLFSKQDAIYLLQKYYNPKCVPPWDDLGLERKVDEAIRTPCEKPDGWLLNEQKTHKRTGQLPRIVIDTKEERVNDEVIKALASDPDLYQRGHELVRVIDAPESETTTTKTKCIKHSTGPVIQTISTATLRERMTSVADFVKTVGGATETFDKQEHPPAWCINAVKDRGKYPGIRNLSGVTEFPIVRPDGSVCDSLGYDEATEVFVGRGTWCNALKLILQPTHDDAKAAAQELLKVVVDFPFAGEQSKAAWVAALLTPLARYTFSGPTPLTMVDANSPGVGKGMLVCLISRILMGTDIATATYSHDPQEMRKLITAIALSADRLILLDNVSGQFGGSVLDALLTSVMWRDRLLGENRQVVIPLITSWFATANNVTIVGDMFRRVLFIKLHTTEEKPEERSNFTHPDLMEWVEEHRSRLLSAALTILSAYIQASCPPHQNLSPFGSYEGWNRVVRGAVIWAGLHDPCENRSVFRESADSEYSAMQIIYQNWTAIDPDLNGLTTKQILKKIEIRDDLHDKVEGNSSEKQDVESLNYFRDAIEEISPKLSSQSLGNKFRKWKDRVLGEYRLEQMPPQSGSNRWRVMTAFTSDGGHGGHGGHVSYPSLFT